MSQIGLTIEWEQALAIAVASGAKTTATSAAKASQDRKRTRDPEGSPAVPPSVQSSGRPPSRPNARQRRAQRNENFLSKRAGESLSSCLRLVHRETLAKPSVSWQSTAGHKYVSRQVRELFGSSESEDRQERPPKGKPLATIQTGHAQRELKRRRKSSSEASQHQPSSEDDNPLPAVATVSGSRQKRREERKEKLQKQLARVFPPLSPPEAKSPRGRLSSPTAGRTSSPPASGRDDPELTWRWGVRASPPFRGDFRERWEQRHHLRLRLERLSRRVIDAAEEYRVRRVAFLRERESFVEVYEATRFLVGETYEKIDSLGRGSLEATNQELEGQQERFDHFRRAVEEDALPFSGIVDWDFEEVGDDPRRPPNQ